MRVGFVGSRNFEDQSELVDLLIDSQITLLDDTDCVVSGGARGIDRLSVYAATMRGLKTDVFSANWSLGSFAGMQRNITLIQSCDRVVVFWDGKSRGTQHAIKTCRDSGIPFRIVFPNGWIYVP